jgi:hypothetical protein
MGILFVVSGAVAFEVSPRWHNVILGGGFGLLHLVFGSVIRRIDSAEHSPA